VFEWREISLDKKFGLFQKKIRPGNLVIKIKSVTTKRSGDPGNECGKICPPGEQRDIENVACDYCPFSTYKVASGDHACSVCPEFSDHALTRQISINACLCRIGYLWNATSQICDQCPAGTFNNKVNDTRCFECVSSSDVLQVYGTPLVDFAHSCGVDGMTQCACMSVYKSHGNPQNYCNAAFDKNPLTFLNTLTQTSSLIYMDFGKSRGIVSVDSTNLSSNTANLVNMAGR